MCCMQLRYSDLKPSSEGLSDKRAYHAKLLAKAEPVVKKRE